MTLTGLLRQQVVVTPTTWTGTTATTSTPVTYPARVERNVHTAETELGDTTRAAYTAYLPADAVVTSSDTISYSNVTYRPASITEQIGGDGTRHHLVVDLATLNMDTVTITRPAAAGAWDPSTGLVDQQPPTRVWSGAATISPSTRFTASDAAGQDVHTVKLDVLISTHTPTIAVGDVVTVDASSDPNLVGVDLRVDGISAGSSQHGQHLLCLDDRTNR